MSDLFSLTYVSSAKGGLGPSALAQILSVARSRNQAEQLTGILVFGDGGFVQTLEGPKSGLLRVFNSILQDRRHHGVITVKQDEIEERAFADWSMAGVFEDDLSEPIRADLRQLRQQAFLLMGGPDEDDPLFGILLRSMGDKLKQHLTKSPGH